MALSTSEDTRAGDTGRLEPCTLREVVLLVVFKIKKLPEPLLIVAAGVIGLIVHQVLGVTLELPG